MARDCSLACCFVVIAGPFCGRLASLFGGSVDVEKHFASLNHTLHTNRSTLHLDGLIGRGDQSEVWAVKSADVHTQSPLVLRVALRTDDTNQLPFAKSCEKSRVLKRLVGNHSVICHYTGQLDVAGVALPYAVWERAPGRTLRSALRSSAQLPPAELGNLTAVFDMVLGLYDLVRGHSARVRFRPLHWANVLVTASGHLTLIDYDEVGFCFGDSVDAGLDDMHGLCQKDMAYYRGMTNIFLFTIFLLSVIRMDHYEEVFWNGVEPKMRDSERLLLPRAAQDGFLVSDPSKADGAPAAASILPLMRSAYREEWSRLPEGLDPISDGFYAMQKLDLRWPPRFIEAIRRARDAIK